jgi:branched-chain amino acid transport system permease protein
VDRILVSVLGGFSLGGTYALVILGLVLAYRATGTLSFAHGQLTVVGAFVVGWALQGHFPFWISIPLGLAVSALLAAAFYQLALQQTIGLPEFMGVIATLGFAAMLDGLVSLVFGPVEYVITLPAVSHGVIRIGGVSVDSASMVLAAITIALATGMAAFLRFTSLGTQIRAAGKDPLLASQGGINVRWIFVGSWAASGCLATLAGVGYGSATIVSHDLQNLALAALPAMLLGGLDSIVGAVVGSLLIGLLQGFLAAFVGGESLNVVSYLLLLVVMLIRPYGLFGSRPAARV